MGVGAAIPEYPAREQLALYRDIDGLEITAQPIDDPNVHAQIVSIEFNRGKRRYHIGRDVDGRPLMSCGPNLLDRQDPNIVRPTTNFEVEQIFERIRRKVFGHTA